jgi:hypothetical protein
MFRVHLTQPVPQRCRARLAVELLETRTLLSVMAPGLTPMQIRHAYGFDQLPLSSNDGSGQTIAIVDAYDNANIGKDIDTFDQAYGVTSGTNLYQQYGGASSFLTKAEMTTPEPSNPNWGHEIALDVEWAHAIAPGAKILLVEAASSSLGDLLSAVDYATNNGATVVSMSWGVTEFAGETTLDSHFNHGGVTYVASAGDTAGTTQWPAVSPNVLGVGGTSLTVNGSGTWIGETGWSSTSGGVSPYEGKPSYQSNVPQSTTHRTSPDVAYDADPATGLVVYDTYGQGTGWSRSGGTSAGAPQWAALVAIADQGRGGGLGSSQTLSDVYAALSSTNHINATYFHDIPAPGYDLVSGLGTPHADQLIPLLRSGSHSTPVASSGPSSTSAGSSINQSGKSTFTPTASAMLVSADLSMAVLAAQAQQAGVISSTASAPLFRLLSPLPPVTSSFVASPPSSAGSVQLNTAPATFVPGTALSLNFRIESGGGNNSLLLEGGSSTDEPEAIPAPVLDSDGGAESSAVPAVQELGRIEQAHTAYFAVEDWSANARIERLALPESCTDEVSRAFDPAAAVACLALGGFWGTQADERERAS